VSGEFIWPEADTLRYKPDENLDYKTEYQVTAKSGTTGISELTMETDYSFQFVTAAEEFSLPVPYFRQPYQYACNLTAARMVLAYEGIDVEVDELYENIEKSTIEYNETENVWGDPNLGFIGDIRGRDKGYGVHWQPVADLLKNYIETAEVERNWDRTSILAEVKDGNPAIIWAHNGFGDSGTETTWELPSGEEIFTVDGMHSYVVVGWIGSLDDPEKIILIDPAGRGRWEITPEKFADLWSTFDNTAIVVKD
jgi:uncharacterized protein YvpB